jgi:hypothetical protein
MHPIYSAYAINFYLTNLVLLAHPIGLPPNHVEEVLANYAGGSVSSW